MSRFPHLHQPDSFDCGATCLAMIARHYGKSYTIQKLRDMCSASRSGVSMLGISDAAEKLGFKTMGVRVGFEKLAEDAPLPCIVHWKQEHFVVVYDIRGKKRKRASSSSGGCQPSADGVVASFSSGYVRVADPAHGLIRFTIEEFCANCIGTLLL